MQDVKTPLGNQVKPVPVFLGLVLRGRLAQYEIKEATVGVPAVDAIADAGTFDRLKVAEREFVVEREEKLVVGTFGGDGFGRGPGGGGEVFGGEVAEGADVQRVLLGRDERTTGHVVEVEHAVASLRRLASQGHGIY